MDPDSYQQVWQAHSPQMRVTIDDGILLKEVQRDQRNLRAEIFWQDFGGVGIALLMLLLWFCMGVTLSLPWSWYLTVPILVWFAVFLLVHRMRHKQKPSEPSEPLLYCLKVSLTQVENQIWLQRNVLWWGLLPISVSALAFFAHVAWLSRSGGWFTTLLLVVIIVVAGAIMAVVHFLNQRVLRLELEPRRQELLTLLTSLRDETTSED